MSDVKELVHAVIAGENYQEIFKTIMNQKVLDKITQEKERIAKSLFETTSQKEVTEEKADLSKISTKDLSQIIKLHKLRATPESMEAANRGEAELERRRLQNT